MAGTGCDSSLALSLPGLWLYRVGRRRRHIAAIAYDSLPAGGRLGGAERLIPARPLAAQSSPFRPYPTCLAPAPRGTQAGKMAGLPTHVMQLAGIAEDSQPGGADHHRGAVSRRGGIPRYAS